MSNHSISNLLDIMEKLRDPQSGCPWDIEQTFATIAPYTIEEAYEVADAIDRGQLVELKDELGDLLLQVVFHAQMAAEQGAFNFEDVVAAIGEKMVRRHPHVFGEAHIGDTAEQTAAWEDHKRQERAGKPANGALEGIAQALPALMRASKLGKRAAAVGFDWPDAAGVREKIDEELAELAEAQSRGQQDEISEEIGDLLFSVANLARHLKVDPEEALRGGNAKFARRFSRMEQELHSRGVSWDTLSASAMEALWQQIKHQSDEE